MSHTKIAKLLLQAIMQAAQIPGLSIAYLDSAGTISTQEMGLTDGCGLCRMATDPTQCPFNEMGLGTKNAVVAFNDELFYVDQTVKIVQKIQLTDHNKVAFEKLQARCTELYALADADSDDYELIHSLTNHAPPTTVQPKTVFGAASLSKPVFAYLVQKLIKANADNLAKPGSGQFILPASIRYFDLDTPLFHILPLEKFSIDGIPKFVASDESTIASANTLTARMVLSHMTGLAHGEIKFQFKPEEKAHGYSNVAILYLQKVIEILTDSNIEVLAKEHVFKFCRMTHSTYEPPAEQALKPQATHTLRTTATDYANFVQTLMRDNSVENPFVPRVCMTEDRGLAGAIGVAAGKILDADLSHVAWGLSWGLQIDNKGDATTAYHSGDMNDCRAWVAVNLKDNSAVVFFANSHNGHILAEHIIPPTIQMKHAANYFFAKWGFARNLAELGGETNNFGLASPEPVQQQLSEEQEDTDGANKSLITPLKITPTPR